MTDPGGSPRLKGRVWITRAEPGAARTAARLSTLGYDPVVAPLLEIRVLPQPAPDLSDVAALVFTSRNAVSAFASLTAARDRSVLTVGDATAEAARAAGFADVRSASGDLQALAQRIAADPPPPVLGGLILHPAAREPAGDLAALLGPSIPVRTLPVYEAVETGAEAPDAFDAILIHSPRAARALIALAGTGLDARLAVAISPAAAAPLAAAGLGEIRIAATPDEDALIAALGKAPPPV